MCTTILRAYLTGGDVAATNQLRQLGRLGRPKHGLRSHQGDVAATDQSQRLGRPKHGLHSHIAETSRRLESPPSLQASEIGPLEVDEKLHYSTERP